MRVIPNTPPDGQVRVIAGTVGIAGVAVAQLLGRGAVVRFPAGSGCSAQALLDQRASLDTSALVRGRVAVGVRKLSGRTVAARRDLLRVVGPLVSGFCVDSTGTPRQNVTGSVVGSGSRRSLRFSAVHRPSAVSLQSLPLNSIEPHSALSSPSLTSSWRAPLFPDPSAARGRSGPERWRRRWGRV